MQNGPRASALVGMGDREIAARRSGHCSPVQPSVGNVAQKRAAVKELPAVTAIIPTRNRRIPLRTCLDSLKALKIHVVVVDNGSTDGTAEMVRSRYGEVELIVNRGNLGAARAKNQGAARAQGSILWFLDSDSVVPGGWVVDRAVWLLDRDESIGAVGGEILPGPEGRDVWRRKVLLPNGETETIGSAGGYGGTVDADYLPTCNLFIRRGLFEEVGGFDPEYFFLMEDADLCCRLRQRGLRCIADDGAAVTHDICMDGRQGDLYQVHRNRIRYVLLNSPLWHALFLPALDLAFLARPFKLRSLLRSEVSAQKQLPSSLRDLGDGALGTPTRLLGAGLVNLWSAALAYGWNVGHLPQTLVSRFGSGRGRAAGQDRGDNR